MPSLYDGYVVASSLVTELSATQADILAYASPVCVASDYSSVVLRWTIMYKMSSLCPPLDSNSSFKLAAHNLID